MAPEYGATCGFFPVDDETLRYLRLTGRAERARRARRGLLQGEHALARARRGSPTLLAGRRARPRRRSSRASPARAARRTACRCSGEAPSQGWQLRRRFGSSPTRRSPKLPGQRPAPSRRPARAPTAPAHGRRRPAVPRADGETVELGHGAVVIAAITSCTNTSNPQVMIGAGLLAKKAVERGLRRKPWVKTSLAPGSQRRRPTTYESAGLTPYLEAARLPPRRLRLHDLHRQLRAAARAGLARRSPRTSSSPAPCSRATATSRRASTPRCKANYLASPPLVVAYALAGRDGHRPHERAARARPGRQATSTCATSGPAPREIADDDRARRSAARCSSTAYARRLRRRRALARAARLRGRALRLGASARPTCAGRPTSTA